VVGTSGWTGRTLLKTDAEELALTSHRANIGNAKAAGLLTDLNMTSRQYSIALTVTYVPYIVAEYPITMLIKIL
jgi:hypothetical protein